MEWLILLLIAMYSAITRALDYSNLEALGATCRPRDTCSSNVYSTSSIRNCECDDRCFLFDDCCIDASGSGSHNGAHRTPGITCIPLFLDQGAFAIGKCRRSWNKSDVVIRKCEDPDDYSDPLNSLPATDVSANVTYRNRYCAECNNAPLSDLSFWDMMLTCNSLADIHERFDNITQDFIIRNIIRLGGSWGVYHWNESLEGMAFYPCEVFFRRPSYLRLHVRNCRPQLLSTCATNWSRNRIRRYCSAYMAAIYISGQGYRNAHCALCNNVSINNHTCDLIGAGGISVRNKPPSLSFALLLDINQNDGGRVGESDICSSGKRYDPFFKKCRSLFCAIPGTVLRGDRCVRQ